jgi:hypothetical protein
VKKYWWAWLLLGLVLAPIAVMFALLAARDLGGPTPVTPQRAAIVGVWTNPDGATLDFAADGKVKASKMPVVDGAGDGIDELPGNGAGTWQIDPWDSGTGSGGGVDVTIGYDGAELTTTGNPAHPKLFIFIGDPDDDNEFAFTKQG